MLFRKKDLALVLFFFISLIVVIHLVKIGYVIAHAEEGIPFHDSVNLFDIYKNVWVEKGLGYSTPFYIARLPFYGAISVFVKWGVEPWLLQATLFFSLIFIALVFVRKLFLELFPQINSNIAILASVFYLFNYFVMTQIWNRFLYYMLFSWTYLPVFLYLWIKVVRNGRIQHVFYFIISSLFFSTAFSPPSTLIPFWVSAVLFSITQFLITKEKKIFPRSILIILFWVIVNIWWLVTLVSFKDTSYTSILSGESAYESLEGVSKYFTVWDVIQLKQKFYFSSGKYFDTFASEGINQLISWAFIILIFLGIFSSKNYKSKYFIVLLYVVSVFFSKGVNPPFGEMFYSFIFKHIPATQILRNPYEKFGILVVLCSSILLVLGVDTHLKKRKRYLIIILAGIFGAFIIIGRPMWNGDVFPGLYYVKVPDEYAEVNNITSEFLEQRIYHIPFNNFPSISYSWGYTGEEPSNFLFTNPSISQSTSFDENNTVLSWAQKYSNHPDFAKLLPLMSVKYILCHDDYISSSYMIKPKADCNKLDSYYKHITQSKMLDSLSLYEIDSEIVLPPVYLAKKIIYKDNLDEIAKDALTLNNLTEIAFINKTIEDDLDIRTDLAPLPDYKVEKIDSENYLVKIKGAKDKYVVVLANSFNSGWEALVNNNIIEKHFKVNGFANGWLIDMKGDYTIDINYKIGNGNR